MASVWTSVLRHWNSVSAFAIATAFGTLIALLGSVVSFYGDSGSNILTRRSDIVRFELDATRMRLELLTHDLVAMRKETAALKQTPISDAALRAKISEIDQMHADLAELKAIIVENPAKALSLPLMQKDLSDRRKREDDLATTMDVQIGRIYDFSKWFLALMITLAIGLVTMGFFRAGKAP